VQHSLRSLKPEPDSGADAHEIHALVGENGEEADADVKVPARVDGAHTEAAGRQPDAQAAAAIERRYLDAAGHGPPLRRREVIRDLRDQIAPRLGHEILQPDSFAKYVEAFGQPERELAAGQAGRFSGAADARGAAEKQPAVRAVRSGRRLRRRRRGAKAKQDAPLYTAR